MKKIIVISVIICLCFLFLFFLNSNRNLTLIESFIKNTTLFIEEIVDKPISYIDKNLKKIKEKNKIYKKYKILKEENKNLKLENNKYKATLDELNNLKENLNLKNSLIDYKIIDAYVINRNIGTFYNQVIIDKGKNDGIKKGMSVINNSGLVGIITKVTNNNSVVKLITSNSKKIGVEVNNQYGLITNYQNGYFIIEGVNDNFSENDLVVTIPTDNIPKGLKIGYIKKSITDKFNLTKKIYVKSYVNFDKLDYLMVLDI